MLNTSLLEILRTFTPEEIKKFQDFVDSPYHNKKSTVVSLYMHIKKCAPEFNSAKLEKEKVWNALYKGKEFNYGVFKNLVYDLTHLAERFIALEFSGEEHLELNINLLQSLYKRHIKRNIFLPKFDLIKKDIINLEKNKKINFDNYSNYLSELHLLRINYCSEVDSKIALGDEFDQHSIFLVSFLLHKILMTGFSAISFSRDFQYNKDGNIIVSFLQNKGPDFILELLESLKINSRDIYEILNVFYKNYESLINPLSVEKYLDFKEAVISNAEKFSKIDLYNLYTCLQNHCINLPSSEINKSEEIIKLTNFKIRDGVLLNNGLLDTHIFISTIHVAFNLGDSNFIEDFSKRFIKYLPVDAIENMQRYSMAHLYFTKGEFENSLKLISTVDYEVIHLKHFLRILQAMNYYELDDFNSFLLLFDSYKHFLSKNKTILEKFNNPAKLFINNLNKLFKLRENLDEFELKNFKYKFALPIVYGGEWFLRKVDELEKKNR